MANEDSAFYLMGVMLGQAVNSKSPGKIKQDGAGAIERDLHDKVRERVSVKDFGAVGDGVTDDTDAIAAAIGSFANGGTLYFPAGVYLVSAGGLSEGVAFVLESPNSNIRFVGDGVDSTFIVPVSNKIEIFAQDGAENLWFEGITFNNYDNGALQNEVLGAGGTSPGGGVADWGNRANCAIRQYRGSNIGLRNVRFVRFNTCLEYYGDVDDNQVLAGHVFSDSVESQECCFVHLLHQEKSLILKNGRCIDNRDSVNQDTSIDPGHFLYQTDRSGAKPEKVVISNIESSGGYSSSIKLRKAQVASISNISINGDGRGIEISNIDGAATVSNVSVKLADTTPDGGRCGFFVDDCRNLEATNITVDTRNADAWGVRVRLDVGSSITSNRDNRYSNITVIADFASSGGKAPLIMSDQSDSIIENFRLVNGGSTANTRYPIDLRSCTRVKVIDPSHNAPLSVGDLRNLVSLDSSCTDCVVAYHPAEALRASPDATTISDSGTGTAIIEGRTVIDGTFTGTLTSGGSAVINFPVPFKFACRSIVGMIQTGSITTAESVFLTSNPSTTGATFNLRPNPGEVSRAIRWIATGY